MSEQFPLALPIGTVLAGQYVVEQILGQGGFGITYCVRDHKTGTRYAIKEFFPDTMATRTNSIVVPYTGERGDNYSYGKECFLEEARTLAEFIGNPGIVRIYSYFEENGTAYFVMDYVDGENLDEYISRKGGSLTFDEAVKLLVPIMDALSIVHSRGIIHRDVTPDNIFITKEGMVKLLDFGAARYSLGDRSQSLDVVLKHGFAPKEQYVRRGKQGPFTDVYALGATFYYALTGKRPPDSIERMEEDTIIAPSTLGVNIPQEAEQAIINALNVQPADRFQNMQAFRNALGQAPQIGGSTVTQRFFTAPENNPVSHTPVMTGTVSDHNNSQLHKSVEDASGLNRYIAKASVYIDEHMQLFIYITFGLFCLLIIFHLFFASKWGLNTWFTFSGKDYKYIQLLMSLPMAVLCGIHAYCIITENEKYLKKGYVVGIAGFAVYILLTFVVCDPGSYGIRYSYYGIVYIFTGLLFLSLSVARFTKSVPSLVMYSLCIIQSLGLYRHLTKDPTDIIFDNGEPLLFDTTEHALAYAFVNAAAFILFMILRGKQENK